MTKNKTIDQDDTLVIIPPLSKEEQDEINHLMAHYPQAGGATIDALKIIQKHRGWVSDTSIKALSLHMNLPLADLDSVATFYNQIFRKPVGKVLIHPCNGISCMLMGSRKVQKQLMQKLSIGEGETTENDIFTLISHPCLGACDKAPVMRINDTLHENVSPDDIENMINKLDVEQGSLDG